MTTSSTYRRPDRGDDPQLPSQLKFTVDEEFVNLLPALSQKQLEGLQASILKEGRCLAPLIVWRETNLLLDGHQRWEIIKQNGELQYEVEHIDIEDREAAIAWIFAHQDNHRSWRSTFEQITHYIERFGPKFQAERKAKMKAGKADPLSNCPKGQTWHDDIAAICASTDNTSARTVRRVAEALQRHRACCAVEDEHQAERTALADQVLEDLKSGKRKPANAKRGFDEVRKEVRRNHAHDEAADKIEKFKNDDTTGFVNQIVKVNDSPLEVLSQLPDEAVGLYFSSYPYYCQKDYGSGEEADNIPYDDQLAFFKSLAVEQFRTLRPGARCVINFDSVTSRPQGKDFSERKRHYKRPIVADLTNLMREVGFLPFQDHVWYKNNHNYNDCNWGSHASPSFPIHIRDWEHILVFSKPGNDEDNPFGLDQPEGSPGPDILPKEFEKWMRGIWQIPIETKDRGGHQCPFPEELAKRVIKLHSYVGDWVIDIFNGSGTTTAVAKRYNRLYTGIDREEAPCRFARERTDNEQPLTSTEEADSELSDGAAPRVLTEDSIPQIWNMDCVEGAKQHLADESIDLGIFDPPWGIGESDFDTYYRRDSTNTIPGYVEAPDDYYAFTYEWMSEAKRVLKSNGSMYVVSGFTHSHLVRRVADELGLHLICPIVYERTFWRMTSRKFSSSFYPVYLFSKSPKARHTFNTECRYAQPDRNVENKSPLYQDLSNVWRIETEPHKDVEKNNNKLPDALIRKMIQYSSNEGDLVCDFFMGNFTTAYVAQQLDRRVTGFEKNRSAFNHHMGLDAENNAVSDS